MNAFGKAFGKAVGTVLGAGVGLLITGGIFVEIVSVSRSAQEKRLAKMLSSEEEDENEE